MQHPSFSIIIPSYNREKFIYKTLKSFLNQTFADFEILVIDDGGNDNSKEVVESFNDSRVKYYWKKNGERGAARNFGAKLAIGDYINYFDSDDLAYTNHLEEAFRAIKELGIPMVFHLGYEMKDEKGKLIHKHRSLNGKGNDKLVKVNYINPNSLFVHKDTIKEVEYCCDRHLSGTEDWLYHLQLAARHDFIAYDKEITCCMIQHDNRSMNFYSGDAVLKRNNLLLNYLQSDDRFMSKYGKRLHAISAEMNGLAALHFVLEKKKVKAVKQLFNSFWLSPVLIFKRRTLAIIKYIFI